MRPDDARVYARIYHSDGRTLLSFARGTKGPTETGWSQRRYEEVAPDRFSPNANVGVLTGKPSGDLVDVDLDCPEAVEIADRLLPDTPALSGREGMPPRHRWYVALEAGSTKKFQDGDSTVLVELRGTGGQTLVPPSVYPEGDRCVWHGTGKPPQVPWGDLRQHVSVLAAAALLARHWRKGMRHDASLALSSILLRESWPKRKVEVFIEAVARAGNDEEALARVKNVATTDKRLSNGAACTGVPALKRLFSEQVSDRVLSWLAVGIKKHEGPSVALDASVATDSPPSWPEPLAETAFYGLAGDFVRLVEPHTEADPAALLVQFLTEFGNVIGRSAHFVAEADCHYTNCFVVLVGETSKGRKGTSHGQVHTRFSALDDEWATSRTMSGLSSGEGLIWQVRDPIQKREPIKKGGRVVEYQDVIVDDGESDKRLLVVESELASTLRVLGRDGNTLSAVIRQAWDTGNLRTLVKNSPAHATDAHVSIIGHITRNELRRYLDRTEAGNGFANRWLWICVKRSKLLPEGGRLCEVNFTPLAQRLRTAVAFAKERGELRRDDEARSLWIEVYETLSTGRTGLFGAVTSRGEAQVMRLACLYALLDCSESIRSPHLEAALEVWGYAEDSARFIFGGDLGDPVADEIRRALRASPEGLTRTQIRDLFGRHQSNATGRALASLAGLGLAYSKPEQTGGRNAERWYAAATKATKATEEGSGAHSGRFRRFSRNEWGEI